MTPRLIRIVASATVGAIVLLGAAPAGASPMHGTRVAMTPAGSGAVGISLEKAIRLPPGRVVTPQDPLRVMLFGDSVLYTAGPAITSALESTGDVVVVNQTFPGWGLTTDTGWRVDLPNLVRQDRPNLIIGTWSWDNAEATDHPAAYRAELSDALYLMLGAAPGVAGVMLLQFPATKALEAPPVRLLLNAIQARAWAGIASSMPSVFPGKVMYLKIAHSVELHGQFTTWLPPVNDLSAPLRNWVRVRTTDGVHFCPAGANRYAAALLADLTSLYHLSAPNPDWRLAAWRDAGSVLGPTALCPDDHP